MVMIAAAVQALGKIQLPIDMVIEGRNAKPVFRGYRVEVGPHTAQLSFHEE